MINPDDIVDRSSDTVIGFCQECCSPIYSGELIQGSPEYMTHYFKTTCEFEKKYQEEQLLVNDAVDLILQNS